VHGSDSATVQQFKGVVEEQNALRGYIVTTSTFTEEAMQFAELSDKLVLVDIDALVRWHITAPTFGSTARSEATGPVGVNALD
jgi:restriction endonuclease Mrr